MTSSQRDNFVANRTSHRRIPLHETRPSSVPHVFIFSNSVYLFNASCEGNSFRGSELAQPVLTIEVGMHDGGSSLTHTLPANTPLRLTESGRNLMKRQDSVTTDDGYGFLKFSSVSLENS